MQTTKIQSDIEDTYIYIYITVSAEWNLKYYKCIPLFQLQHLYSTCQDKGLFLQRKKNQSTIGEKILSESCECLVFGVCVGDLAYAQSWEKLPEC